MGRRDYRLGHLPDPVIHRSYRHVERLIGAVKQDVPIECTWMLPLVDVVLEQPAQSCVGHGVAGCAYVREASERAQSLAASGDAPELAVEKVLERGGREYPSPLFIFANACMRGNYDGADGSRPIDAYAALADYGYPALAAWTDSYDNMRQRPEDLAWIPLQPSNEAYRQAADQRTLLSYRIEDGELVEYQMRRAISQWCPESLALLVDQSYMDNTGEIWTPRGELLGGHYVYAVGYTADALLTVSSYGRAHGRNGIVPVAWSVVADGTITSDRYAATFADAAPHVGS